MLGPMNPKAERYMRGELIRSLSKPQPKPRAEQLKRWAAPGS